MPIFEFRCEDSECRSSGQVFEKLGKFDDNPPLCPSCRRPLERLISLSNVVFVGPLGGSKYNDKNRELAEEEGHWVTRTRSSRRPDGKPERQFIRTFQEQKDYCREEGLYLPSEVPRNMRISSDGRRWENTRGTPGQWI